MSGPVWYTLTLNAASYTGNVAWGYIYHLSLINIFQESMQAIALFASLLPDVVQAPWLTDKSTADFTAPFRVSRVWKFDERKKGVN